jgi:hypothetical protein
MDELNSPLLINILGHAAGALIFAIFLFLLFSRRGWSSAHGRTLPAVAATLSLVWNVGSLVVLTLPRLSPAVMGLVIAVSFSVLSLLPAVLLHISLAGSRRWLIAAGYALSSVAVIMHFREIGTDGTQLHQAALLLITIGFVVLTAIAVGGVLMRGGLNRSGGARIAGAMCLALFAMSFIHFGAGHARQAWSSELFIHHAGIPLALFVLLQDYRFVLLDAFMRFLANALLAALVTGLVIAAAFRLVLVERVAPEPSKEALLMVSVCLILVFFAWLRNRAQALLTHAVFRHGSLAGLAETVKDSPPFENEERYLEWAAGLMARAVKTKDFAVVAQSRLPRDGALHVPVLATIFDDPAALGEWNWAEAIVPVRQGQGNSRYILLGRREGGRRYLGEELDVLARAAGEIAARLEALRQQEMSRLVSQAELRALQSQINPHFLFNALNTLYGTIPREAAGARRMVLNLADIFRYFLQSGETFVPLAQEMQIVRAYLEIEQSRLGGRLETAVEVNDAALAVPIPVLSIQPLVENAIKHGIAQRTAPGYVRIHVSHREDSVRITVENSSSGAAPGSTGPGVGLENVRRRLDICYGTASSLELTFDGDRTVAELSIPLVCALE